jgi:hypothetical protein
MSLMAPRHVRIPLITTKSRTSHGRRRTTSRQSAAQQIFLYSITSSACESREGEIARPSALAVVRLITSSNSVGSVSPSIRHKRTGSDLIAISINGKRLVKSLPFRVTSRTPVGPRRAKVESEWPRRFLGDPGATDAAGSEASSPATPIQQRGYARTCSRTRQLPKR